MGAGYPGRAKGSDVQRIAVIQDGTELVRQTDADVAGFYERCCELLSADGSVFVSQSYSDDTVGNLLEHVDPEEHDCLVIASNALLSERVEHALGRHKDRLHAYLAAGGGMVVLHQLVDSLEAVLPGDLCPGLVGRRSARGASQAEAQDPGDVLLNFPAQVILDGFRDDAATPGPPSLFYKALSAAPLPEKLLPVIAYNDEILLARTYDHVPERVVVATMPLDWQGQIKLLANAIRFACLGRPRRLIWQEQTEMRGALLVRWLSMDGRASVRPPPDPHGAGIGPAEQWLLSNVDLAFAPRGELESICARPEVQRFLDAGGTLLADDPMPGTSANRIVALIGKYTERRLANRLYGELRAVSGWDAPDYAFELRNIVLALCLLWSDPANHTKIAVAPDELSRLKPMLRSRLISPMDREDLSSSIAHAQSMAFLCGAGPLAGELYAWMSGDPRQSRFDVALQIRAVTALATRRPDAGFLAAAAEALGKQADLGSIAPVIRILDTIAVLDQAALLADDAAAVRELARLACGYLDVSADESADGWLSVEATADAARGLAVLLNRIDADAALAKRLASTLGSAMSVLRRSFGRYQANRKGVAWLAGLTLAVVAAERQFPIGLQRLATLEWPERSDDNQGAIGTGLPLLEHLALENKILRDQEREFNAERLAARLGRGTATLGVMAIITAPIVYALVLVGFASAGQLIGNTVLLTALVGVIAVGLALLRRWHLLARPAVRMLDWITETIKPLAWLGGPRDK
jgi:hypothetical protein